MNLESFFNCCSSLTCKFPKFVLFMIISAVVVEVFYWVHGKTTYKWHTDDIRVHTSDIRITRIKWNRKRSPPFPIIFIRIFLSSTAGFGNLNNLRGGPYISCSHVQRYFFWSDPWRINFFIFYPPRKYM